MESSPPTTLNPGDTLGPYRIESLIGKGGMGEVYRGTDTRLGLLLSILPQSACKLVGSKISSG